MRKASLRLVVAAMLSSLASVSVNAQEGCALLGEKIYDAMADWRKKPADADLLQRARERVFNILNSRNALLICAPNPVVDPAATDFAKEAARKALQDLKTTTSKYVASEAARKMVDSQTGAASGASGSTTAVAGGSVPQFLSFAVESGAVTQKVDGTAVTVRVNPVKLVNALRNGLGEIPLPPDDPGYRALSRLNLSFTTDRSRAPSATTTNGVTLTEQFKQVTDVSLRIDLRNDQDPFSRHALRKLDALISSSHLKALHDASSKLGDAMNLTTTTDIVGLQRDRSALVLRLTTDATVDKAAVLTMVKTGVAEINAKHFKDLTPELIQFGSKLNDFKTRQSQIADEIAHGFVATLDFNWKRPPLTTATPAAASGATPQSLLRIGDFRPSAATGSLSTASSAQAPNLYTAQLILSARLIGKSQGTATFGTSFFERKMTGMKDVWRDASAGGKWSIPTGSVKSGKTSLHFSALYQHLHQKPLGIDLSINDVKINKPGNIGLFQAQYRIDMGTSGISIPLSFTASNRTELVKEKELRGNVGISFDLSKLWPF